MEKNTWHSPTTPSEAIDPLNLTVEQFLQATSRIISGVTAGSLRGRILIQTTSDDLSSVSPVQERVLYWALRATAAHSALLYWKETNAYATIRPVKKLLMSCSHGANSAMELYEAVTALLVSKEVLDAYNAEVLHTD